MDAEALNKEQQVAAMAAVHRTATEPRERKQVLQTHR